MTTVNPMLRINHNGDYATGFLDMGGFNETYVNNSGLNFLGSNGTLSLNLDNTVKRVLPNASLLITDAVSYAPLPPGFVNPVAGTAPGAPVNIQDIFARGILFTRTNRITNSGTVSAAYATSASTSVNASYSHALLRFLSDSATAQGGVFDTTTQTATAGGNARLSGVDTLNVRYSYAQSEFSVGSTPSSFFKTHTATAGWSRILTPNFSAEVGGGGIVIDPGRVTYAVNAALIMSFLNSRATISYARSSFPSFAGVPTQVIGDVVSLSAVQQISPQWQLRGTANYSHSSGESGVTTIRFDSYGGSIDVAYLIAKNWSTALGYTYLRFDQEFGATKSEFDRHVVMFSVRATWE